MLHSILSAIGIIGGADGPTAVYVAGLDNPAIVVAASVVVVAIAFAMVCFRRRKK